MIAREEKLSLQAVLLDWSSRPFSYGNDCCQFVNDVLRAVKGISPMEIFQYSNKAEAYRAIRSFGTLVDAITATLGNPLPRTEEVQEFDVVACRMMSGQWIAGIVIGGRIAVKTEVSLMDWPLDYADYRWRL